MADGKDIIAVRLAAEERLRKIPRVVGVGVGPKFTGGQRTNELAIHVFVSEKKTLNDIPESERIPETIEGFKTDVLQLGPITVGAGPTGPTKVLDPTKYDVMRGGIEIQAAGTLGCMVRIGADRVALMTNQHVLFSGDDVSPGCAHSVAQPDAANFCECLDCCSRVVAHELTLAVHSQTVDAALADLIPGTKWRPEVQDPRVGIQGEGNHTRLTGTRFLTGLDLINPYPVYKRGITTLQTQGDVVSITVSGTAKNADGTVNREYVLSMLIASEPDPNVPFSDHGDSGSVVFNDAKEVVGLLFAGGKTAIKTGGPQIEVGAASMIESVLKELSDKAGKIVTIATVNDTPEGVQVVPPGPPPSAPPGDYPSLPTALARNDPAPPGSLENLRHDFPKSTWSRLAKTKGGQELTASFSQHQREIRELIKTRRRVVAGWRRYGGQELFRLLNTASPEAHLRLPSNIAGMSFADCVRRFTSILLRYASQPLARDLNRYAERVQHFGGLSVQEVIASLETPIAPSIR